MGKAKATTAMGIENEMMDHSADKETHLPGQTICQATSWECSKNSSAAVHQTPRLHNVCTEAYRAPCVQ